MKDEKIHPLPFTLSFIILSTLTALYKTPADTAAFDDNYFNIPVLTMKKVPSLQSIDITKLGRTLVGDGFYLMAVLHFADDAALQAAMKSPEMAEADKSRQDAMKAGIVTMMFGATV